jgi:starvation-inducible DNA-binding protein
MNKRKINEKLATPNFLNEKGRQEIIASLNPLVADAFALYIKAKNFHWHVSGPHFQDYHLLFDSQADQIFAMIDVLAERARKLGGLTIHSTGEVARLQRIKDSDEDFLEPEKMLQKLMNDNENYAAYLHNAHKICEKHSDVATCSILEIFLDETERRIWFLFETLSPLI